MNTLCDLEAKIILVNIPTTIEFKDNLFEITSRLNSSLKKSEK